ncbi:MAG: endonuclease, partial [Alphaproteobacteria bacterium]|nr:endonuclease [Alphaproteobacteria bacterium]
NFAVHSITDEELRQKAQRMEWEHIVPAQNFGKSFKEWSEGHPRCVSNKGKKFKGRSCAEQESEEFRYMYTDMYNLYPSIGAVNYLRSNFNFAELKPEKRETFCHCGGMRISQNKVMPNDKAKGLIARTYLYMQATYPRYRIGEPMYGVLKAWDKQYPITRWECRRAYRIEKAQGNANPIVKPRCQAKGWYED